MTEGVLAVTSEERGSGEALYDEKLSLRQKGRELALQVIAGQIKGDVPIPRREQQ